MIRVERKRPLTSLLFAALAAVCLAATSTARASDAPRLADRQAIYAALLAHRVFDPDRQLVHLSHVCSLAIKGKSFPVVDVQELVPGAVVPRGVNRIVVLDGTLAPVRIIEYTSERPLFCKDQRLFVFGDLAVDGLDPAGNVLVFSEGGRVVKVEQMDVNQLPVPRTGKAKGELQ